MREDPILFTFRNKRRQGKRLAAWTSQQGRMDATEGELGGFQSFCKP
jgi:hypothetical protein